MKNLFVIIVTMLSLSAGAEAPKVSCDLFWSRVDATGITLETTRSKLELSEKGSTTMLKSFVVTGGLQRICAADGGPCSDAYHLQVYIGAGKSKSFLGTVVSSKNKNSRYSTALSVEKESVFVNCDL